MLTKGLQDRRVPAATELSKYPNGRDENAVAVAVAHEGCQANSVSELAAPVAKQNNTACAAGLVPLYPGEHKNAPNVLESDAEIVPYVVPADPCGVKVSVLALVFVVSAVVNLVQTVNIAADWLLRITPIMPILKDEPVAELCARTRTSAPAATSIGMKIR